MNVGILYPRSNVYPRIGFDFLDGIKTYLKSGKINAYMNLHSDCIGFGGSEKEVYEKAEKMLMSGHVDVLVAFIDLKVLSILNPLLNASGKLMMVVNTGANFPENWIPQSNIIFLSLRHSFLCWLGGALAIRKKNTRAVLASTYYDCGYLHSAAMVKNFVRSGGRIMFTYMNRQNYDDTFHIDELSGFLYSDVETKNLLCVFDSKPASLFYNRLNHDTDADALHLYVSPMMLEQTALIELPGTYRFSIEGYAAWLPSLQTESNLLFTKYYKLETNRQPDIFSLLGWEAGLILQQLILYPPQNYSDGETIVEHLKQRVINSPRGGLKLDKETNYFLAPFIKCSVLNNEPVLKTELVENTETGWNTFVNEPAEGFVSGWTNTYLCY